MTSVTVVDDHSSVPNEDIVERFQRALPITYLRNQGPKGPAAARNLAAAQAEGSILAFLDDDAIPAPDWLQVIDHRFLEPSHAAITGQIRPLDAQFALSRSRQLRYELRQRRARSSGNRADFLLGGNSAIRREDFEALGGFDARFELMHDRELLLRLSALGRRCVYVDELLVFHKHSKGAPNALGGAFVSARFRRLMEQRHPTLARWTPADAAKSVLDLCRLGFKNHQPLAALLASTLELVHGFGYLWYALKGPGRSARVALPVENGRKPTGLESSSIQ